MQKILINGIKDMENVIGFLRGFSSYSSEFDSGNEAIVELENGKCEAVPIEWITFLPVNNLGAVCCLGADHKCLCRVDDYYCRADSCQYKVFATVKKKENATNDN